MADADDNNNNNDASLTTQTATTSDEVASALGEGDYAMAMERFITVRHTAPVSDDPAQITIGPFTTGMLNYWQSIDQAVLSFYMNDLTTQVLPSRYGQQGVLVFGPPAHESMPPHVSWMPLSELIKLINLGTFHDQLVRTITACDQLAAFALVVSTRSCCDIYYVCYITPSLPTPPTVICGGGGTAATPAFGAIVPETLALSVPSFYEAAAAAAATIPSTPLGLESNNEQEPLNM